MDFKKGDYVLIIRGEKSDEVEEYIGKRGTITDIEEDCQHGLPYEVKFPDGAEDTWFRPDELKKIKTKTQKAKEKIRGTEDV